jgi:CTP:molybdopterin cytidylyltransferase MocA
VRLAAIVLAAGAGERLGGPKALALAGGRTFIERVLGTCGRSAVDEIVVVTGAGAADVGAAALRWATDETPLRIVENAAWREGRTGSVQAGWASCEAGVDALVFPVDHPAVRLVSLDAMIGVFGHAGGQLEIVVPTFEREGRRRRGHPVLLSSALRDEVLRLGKDEPLRDVVHRHEVLEVPVDDEGVLLDVDAPEDLARLERLLAER